MKTIISGGRNYEISVVILPNQYIKKTNELTERDYIHARY